MYSRKPHWSLHWGHLTHKDTFNEASQNKFKDTLRERGVLICEHGGSSIFSAPPGLRSSSRPVCHPPPFLRPWFSPTLSLHLVVIVPSARPSHSDVTRQMIMRTDCFSCFSYETRSSLMFVSKHSLSAPPRITWESRETFSAHVVPSLDALGRRDGRGLHSLARWSMCHVSPVFLEHMTGCLLEMLVCRKEVERRHCRCEVPCKVCFVFLSHNDLHHYQKGIIADA